MSYYEEDCEFRSYLSQKKLLAPPDKHVTNKNEGRLLRKLMQKSGKSEDELRKDKSVRCKLADARSAMGNGSNAARLRRRNRVTVIAEQLGLPFYDPLVQRTANTEERTQIKYF